MDNSIIPFIHNYCNRWCERCNFITRCNIGILEIKMNGKEDLSKEEYTALFEKSLGEMLELEVENEELEMLNEIDEIWDENDFELPEFTEEEIHEENIKQLLIESNPIIKLSEDYFQNAKNLLDKLQLENSKEIEVITWYLHFIHIKIDRALNGLDDDLEAEFLDDPYQTDSNGSAKVAIIGIKESLYAWKMLSKKVESIEINSIIQQLKTLQNLTEKTFPNFFRFIRPGFDE